MEEFKMFDLVRNLISNLLESVPNILGAIIILIIGWIIAKVASGLIKKLFKSLQIDKLAEKLNDIDIISKANIKIVPSVIISKIVYYLFLLIFLIAATDKLGMPAISNLVSDIINYVPNLLTALVLLAIGLVLADLVKGMVLTACKSLGIPSANIISTVVFYFIFLNILLSALAQAKVNMEFITLNLALVIGGVVLAFAIGYGLASKTQMANMLASFTVKKKYSIGDNLTVDGHSGTVTDIDNNTITLETEGKKVIMPLSKLTENNVEVHI